MTKPKLTEADAEAIADRMLWKRMNTDPAYVHAESAEAQAEREEELGLDVWSYLEEKYEIA